jgi:hypothetical protein
VNARDGDADDFGRLKTSSLFYIETTSVKVLQVEREIIYARICFAKPNTPKYGVERKRQNYAGIRQARESVVTAVLFHII